jgi:predicted XRE-type DNA-binding protein
MTKHRKGQTLKEYMAEQYAATPGLKEEVDTMVAEMELEQDLVALRESRQISQSALARLLGVSQPAVAKLESDKVKNVKISTLAKYVAALGGRLKVEIVPGPRKLVGLKRPPIRGAGMAIAADTARKG